MSKATTVSGARALRLARIVAVNVFMLMVLTVPVELVLGNWVRPFGLRDLRRFSIPIELTYSFDPSSLYSEDGSHVATYSRDEWGLRRSAGPLVDIRIVTVGGSTTDQRYLDDSRTWKAVAERELLLQGRRMAIANAGFDGQSTVGHLFNFRCWFPLIEGLRPTFVIFYVGINDVLRGEDRDDYDRSVDAAAWRNKSVLYQLYRVVVGNVRARDIGVAHGRRRPAPEEFTDQGLLGQSERQHLAEGVTGPFLERIGRLGQATATWGATPLFVTQTAFWWNADRRPPRGLKGVVRTHGRTVNFADVAAMHQHLNRRLMAYCADQALTCFDLGTDVEFVAEDYYDPLHNTPAGAEKIGRYLAGQVVRLAAATESMPQPQRSKR